MEVSLLQRQRKKRNLGMEGQCREVVFPTLGWPAIGVQQRERERESLPRFHQKEKMRAAERSEKASTMSDHGRVYGIMVAVQLAPRIRSNKATNSCMDARLPKHLPGSHRIHLLQP